MEAIILIGIQGAGKSTFCRERLFNTHVRINLDMLRTRRRERILLDACIEAKQPFVVDNTNPTAADRRRYIEPAKTVGFRVAGYYFSSDLEAAKRRNAQRTEARVVPLIGLLGTYKKLEPPRLLEGFDALHEVQITADGTFVVK